MFLDKPPHELKALIEIANHFRSHAKALGAVEMEDNTALDLLNYGRHLSTQIDRNVSANQKELTADDQLMCEVEILYF